MTNTLHRYVLAPLLLLGLLPKTLWAQSSCSKDAQTATVFYGNGVLTDPGKAQIEAQQLDAAIHQYLNALPDHGARYPCLGPVRMSYATNDGLIFDALESEYQFRLQEFGSLWQLLGINNVPLWLDETLLTVLSSPSFLSSFSRVVCSL